MVIGVDGNIQVHQPILVQLLKQLPIHVCHLTPSWLTPILACFQLLWTQGPKLLLTYSPQAELASLLSG